MNYISQDEMADLIEKGLESRAVEDFTSYLHIPPEKEDEIHACIVGMAYIGLVGDARKALDQYNENSKSHTGGYVLASLLNVPFWHGVLDISYDHFTGTLSTRDIIHKLRKGGYSWKPDTTELS